MSFRSKTLLATCAALAFGAGAADAARVNFALSGAATASWQINTNVAPDSATADGITYYQVQGNFPGMGASGVDIDFRSASGGGGVWLTDFDSGALLQTVGTQLFSGTVSNPVFAPGIFALTGGTGLNYTLSIAEVAAVPEPATWAFVMVGFGLIGLSLRTRDRRRAIPATLNG